MTRKGNYKGTVKYIEPKEKECIECGVTFQTYQPRRYRCPECTNDRGKYRKKMNYLAEKPKIIGYCSDCQAPILRTSSKAINKTGLCRNCYLKMIREYPERANNWKGGVVILAGYKFIFAPDHPRATRNYRYIQEHVLVWEATHNEFLSAGWIIHHLNGDKLDNRPENLVACRTREHKNFIRELQTRIKFLES